MRLALIGAGRIGRIHARNIATHPDAELALVADPVAGAADAVAAPLGVRTSADVADAYTADDVDAVVICSPTPFHVEHITGAIAAGKAVLVEKPVDLDLARVDECIAAIAGAEHRVMVAFNRRFDTGNALVQRRLAEGEIGPLEQLTIVSRDPAPPPASYIAQSGGIFRDMTIHDFDLARFLLGDFVEVHAMGQRLDSGIAAAGDFSAAVVTMSTATGAVATIINSRHCATGYDQRIEAFGESGSLETVNQLTSTVRYSGPSTSGAASPYLDFFLERYADAYRAELDAFLRAIGDGVAPSPSIFDGREALLLADAATRSATTGERVRVAPRTHPKEPNP
ncbi:inositol 2-dehydrogenase [Lysobacter korlensis]|uniref:Inositol 2-dehydrogenase n=1 Tax=Lysobacter korlensis TaxID=553636 RepID=A0ABV6RU35_9GAMM